MSFLPIALSVSLSLSLSLCCSYLSLLIVSPPPRSRRRLSHMATGFSLVPPPFVRSSAHVSVLPRLSLESAILWAALALSLSLSLLPPSSSPCSARRGGGRGTNFDCISNAARARISSASDVNIILRLSSGTKTQSTRPHIRDKRGGEIVREEKGVRECK